MALQATPNPTDDGVGSKWSKLIANEKAAAASDDKD